MASIGISSIRPADITSFNMASLHYWRSVLPRQRLRRCELGHSPSRPMKGRMGTADKRQRSREAPELGRKPPWHLSCPEHIDADCNFGLQTFLNRVFSVGVLHSLSGRSGDSNARRVWPTKRSRL